MLYTLALILLVLWAVGLVGAYTMHGFVHVLLVAAIVLVLVRIIQGRRGARNAPFVQPKPSSFER